MTGTARLWMTFAVSARQIMEDIMRHLGHMLRGLVILTKVSIVMLAIVAGLVAIAPGNIFGGPMLTGLRIVAGFAAVYGTGWLAA